MINAKKEQSANLRGTIVVQKLSLAELFHIVGPGSGITCRKRKS
jgi:hypothetical protein